MKSVLQHASIFLFLVSTFQGKCSVLMMKQSKLRTCQKEADLSQCFKVILRGPVCQKKLSKAHDFFCNCAEKVATNVCWMVKYLKIIFFFLESFQTWINWRYLLWISRWWSLSDSAELFSTGPHLSTAHLKKESCIGLVYLQTWCVISVFWGWNVTDSSACVLWASSSLCDMSQGT